MSVNRIVNAIYILIAILTNKAEGQTLLDYCLYAEDICPNEHIKFWLYKNGLLKATYVCNVLSETLAAEPLLLNPLQLRPQDFSPQRQLKILIHGFTGHRNFSPNPELRPVLLQTQSVHVLTVDYGALSRVPCYYPWAVENAPIVAKCVAQLIDNLIANGIYKNEDIHLIGFSLGGQIAGLTANYVQNKLRHITGLDPARPGFATENLTKKLDASDAAFVDVIHTDLILYGVHEPCGHVDFYPNFEFFFQTGCSYYENGVLRNCNHFRAPLYYAESITTKSGFWSYACGSWWEFIRQNCHKYAHMEHILMGYFTPENARGLYFLTTNSVAPFARGHLIQTELEVIEKL